MTTATLSHDATIADVLAISEGYVRGMYENMYEVRSSTESESHIRTIERIGYLAGFRLW
jgi:hypothetical protein